MQDDEGRDRLLSRYLLGQLPEEERDSLEERLFTDDGLFERLQICESELFDAYARDELPQEDRQRFETRFLGQPEARRKIAFARALAHRASLATPLVPERAPWWRGTFSWFVAGGPVLQVGIVAAVVALVVCPLLLLREGAGTRREVARRAEAPPAIARPALPPDTPSAEGREAGRRSQTAPPQARGAPSRPTQTGTPPQPREVRTLPEPPARLPEEAGPVIARALSGGELDTLDLPPGERAVRLELELPAEERGARGEAADSRSLRPAESRYRGFLATLQAASGLELREFENLRAERVASGGRSVSLEMPSWLLVPGEYVLRLRGVGPDGTPEPVRVYRFRVGR